VFVKGSCFSRGFHLHDFHAYTHARFSSYTHSVGWKLAKLKLGMRFKKFEYFDAVLSLLCISKVAIYRGKSSIPKLRSTVMNVLSIMYCVHPWPYIRGIS